MIADRSLVYSGWDREMKDEGWGSDHVGKLDRLQTAVSILSEGKATYPLSTLFPHDFPKHLRNSEESSQVSR
jgi:hypothetical protein